MKMTTNNNLDESVDVVFGEKDLKQILSDYLMQKIVEVLKDKS